MNRTAIITGAASGIGLAIARRLAQDGVRVALLDLNSDKLLVVAAELGGGAVAWPLDLTQPEAVNAVISEIAGQFGRIDVLVNAAGITGLTQTPTHDMPLAEVQRVFAINFWGSLHTT